VKVLKKEMRLKRMNSEMLAAKVGVSKATIVNWLSGSCLPSITNMDKLEALGFSKTACVEPSKEG